MSKAKTKAQLHSKCRECRFYTVSEATEVTNSSGNQTVLGVDSHYCMSPKMGVGHYFVEPVLDSYPDVQYCEMFEAPQKEETIDIRSEVVDLVGKFELTNRKELENRIKHLQALMEERLVLLHNASDSIDNMSYPDVMAIYKKVLKDTKGED